MRKTIIASWQSTKRSTPGRYKPCWNRKLDQLAKIRTKLYRKALPTNQEADKEAYKTIDKLIKKMVKNNKSKRQKAFTDQLENAKPVELGSLYNRLVNNIDETKGEAQKRNLNPEKYTRSLATKMGEAWSPKTG